MRRAVFLSSPEVWRQGHGPNHPLKPERFQRTHELLAEYGAFEAQNVQVIAPRLVTPVELRLFHTAEYVSLVKALSDGDRSLPTDRSGFGPGDNPIFPGMYESEGLKVGSALQAAECLLEDRCDVAFSYNGGLHHGGPDFASGFCVFNDGAVAINWLLEHGLRVAYVDIDVHHGDGVQDAFYENDRVLTISLHQDPQTLFPVTGFVHEVGRGRGIGYSVNVPLPPNTGDEAYLSAFEQIVPPLLVRFQPDIVITQLGVDTHMKDPLANLVLTTAGHLALFQAIDRLAPRWLALGGGGYDISVVPRSWVLAFAVMAGLELPAELPPGYRARYGGEWLYDQESVHIQERFQNQVEQRVATVIRAVRETHELESTAGW